MKQSNKKHKSGGRSKSGLRRLAGAGRVETARAGGRGGGGGAPGGAATAAKTARLNKARQVRAAARAEAVAKKRRAVAAAAAPRASSSGVLSGTTTTGERRDCEATIFLPTKTPNSKKKRKLRKALQVVAIVPLCDKIDVRALARKLGCAVAEDCSLLGCVGVGECEGLSVVAAQHGDVRAALSAAAVADVVLLVMHADGARLAEETCVVAAMMSDDEDDTRSQVSTTTSRTASGSQLRLDDACSAAAAACVDALKAQGLPATLGVLAGLDEEAASAAPLSEKQSRRRFRNASSLARRFYASELGEPVPWARDDDDDQLVRAVRGLAPHEPTWRQHRATVLCADANVVESSSSSSHRLLEVSGWVRGAELSCRRLVHVPGLGALRVSNVAVFASAAAKAAGGDSTRLAELDESKKEPLQMAAEVDGLAGEQTWPEEGEDNHEEEEDMEEETAAKAAAGSAELPAEYQSAWDTPKDDDDDDADDGLDGVALFADLNSRQTAASSRRDRLAEDMQFPDEIDVRDDELARERFARYRALQSFRSAPWDPYEALPRDYAKAFEVPYLARARKAAIRQAAPEACVDNEASKGVTVARRDGEVRARVGAFVTLTLEVTASVAAEALSNAVQSLRTAHGAAAVSQLLRHENRLTVTHFLVRRVADRRSKEEKAASEELEMDDDDLDEELLDGDGTAREEEDGGVVASKDELTARVGCRHYEGRVVFSEYGLGGDKHKYARFLPHGVHAVATLFGPLTFAPAPAFFFKKDKLVAVGHALAPDPNRVILKRCVLTGIPARTHKRKAVIKSMFYNPEDVRYFKPATLNTKHGLTAHITDPVGTHGHFKVSLSRPMKQSDTLMLVLYKRVFPKFTRQAEADHTNKARDGDHADTAAPFLCVT